MIAFAGTYPNFFESVFTSGWPIMQPLVILFILAFAFSIYRLCRRPQLTFGSILLISAPTLIGSALAACQSLAAESIVAANEFGMISWSRPDRYIGHIRVYLAIGLGLSACLLCLAYIRRHRASPIERSA